METKNKGKVAIPLYNNRNCGQILSAEQISSAAINLRNYGIDKLAISFKFGDEFAYRKNHTPGDWTKQETTKPNSEITTKFYNNHPNYNATIQKFNAVNEDYLTIQLNPSKIIHPYKLTTSTDTIANQLTAINEQLKNSGIEIDFEKAKVTRLDVAHNISLLQSLRSYGNVFDSFQGKRQITKVHNDTRYWGNKEHQFTIYDKMKELMNRDLGELPPTQICRSEMRLMNKECVNRIFGSNSLGNIISDEQLYVEKYNDYVREKIFRQNQYLPVQFDYGEIYKLYEKIYFTYGNKAFAMALKSLGIQMLAEQPNGIQNFIEVIKKMHKERTARRHIAELNSLVNLYKINFPEKTKSFIELNQEIKEKIIINPNYLIAV